MGHDRGRRCGSTSGRGSHQGGCQHRCPAQVCKIPGFTWSLLQTSPHVTPHHTAGLRSHSGRHARLSGSCSEAGVQAPWLPAGPVVARRRQLQLPPPRLVLGPAEASWQPVSMHRTTCTIQHALGAGGALKLTVPTAPACAEALCGPGRRFRNLQHGIVSKQALRPLPASKVNLLDNSGLPDLEDDSQKDWSVRLGRQRQAANKTRGYRCCLLPGWLVHTGLATSTAQAARQLHDWCTCGHLVAWVLAASLYA